MNVDWLYAHFQAVGRARSRYSTLILVSALGGALLHALPPTRGNGPLSAALSVTVLVGIVGILAHCGSRVRRREVRQRLATAAGMPLDDLDLLDAHPSTFDFIAAARGSRPRALFSLVDQSAPLAAFLWLLYLWGYAVGTHLPAGNPALILDAATLLAAVGAARPLGDGLRRGDLRPAPAR